MTNRDRYDRLLEKRNKIDKQTKEYEKVIFDLDTQSSEPLIQRWAKLELDRRAVAVEVARQWQTLSREERIAETKKYNS